MAHAPYPSDLTDVEWSVIEPLLPGPSKLGRPRENNLREVWDAFFYIARTGCQWRYLPHDFPPYTSVHRHFREWRDDGTLERVHDALRHDLRKASGKKRGSDGRYIGLTEREDDRSRWASSGYDPAKKVKGRKRQMLVDSMGMIIALEARAS